PLAETERFPIVANRCRIEAAFRLEVRGDADRLLVRIARSLEVIHDRREAMCIKALRMRILTRVGVHILEFPRGRRVGAQGVEKRAQGSEPGKESPPACRCCRVAGRRSASL